ncbi:MAG: formate dehydrogenase accessory sulfurtransferase FdhD, partial [Anaerolineales bacterium]|nr:formate dehydrogenase accessory sulfurtransferase FdhD [Anaerolineales bacterium]
MSQDIVIEGVRPVRYIAIGPGSDQLIDGAIVDEVQACISVNGRELASYMCSPHDLAQLAHGFLFNEG